MSQATVELELPVVYVPRGRGRERTIRIVGPLVVAAALIGVWELWVRAENVSPLLLPEPWVVFKNMVTQRHLIFPEIWTTVKETLVGFTFASAAGILLAVLIVSFRPLELVLYPILVGSQVVPKIALAPVILLLFGLGNTSRIIIIVSLAFFPVVISTVVGLKSVEPAKINLARSLGAGKVRIFRSIKVPQALPDTFGGLKLAATRAVGAAIIAEFITPGNRGLGRLILTTTTELRPDISLACIAYLIAIGVLLFFVVSRIERLTLPWHPSVRGAR
jgi:NitT/TauT family transport system permease protein